MKRNVDTGIQFSIPQKPDERTSLRKCLREHFKKEEVDGVQCNSDACKGRRGNRERVLSVVVGPEILVIQLVRMAYDIKTGQMTKSMAQVDYSERLNLSRWSESPLMYQLHGVVAHDGETLDEGHYVAMVRSQSGDTFVHCNDRIIDDTQTREQVLARADSGDFRSYLLVYQKIRGRMAKCI